MSEMTEEMISEDAIDDVEVSEETAVEIEEMVDADSIASKPSSLMEDVVAECVNIEQGGAQNVKADKVTVSQGGIAHAEGRFIDVKEGGIAIAMGENITITDGGTLVVAANNVKMTDSVVVFAAANEIVGENVKVMVDVRAAAVFALIFGAVMGMVKMIMRNRD